MVPRSNHAYDRLTMINKYSAVYYDAGKMSTSSRDAALDQHQTAFDKSELSETSAGTKTENNKERHSIQGQVSTESGFSSSGSNTNCGSTGSNSDCGSRSSQGTANLGYVSSSDVESYLSKDDYVDSLPVDHNINGCLAPTEDVHKVTGSSSALTNSNLRYVISSDVGSFSPKDDEVDRLPVNSLPDDKLDRSVASTDNGYKMIESIQVSTTSGNSDLHIDYVEAASFHSNDNTSLPVSGNPQTQVSSSVNSDYLSNCGYVDHRVVH